MTESDLETSGTQPLHPRARILRIFGDELISSETVALIELVKNSYDADATRVLVRFEGPLNAGQGKIEVIDNGLGMSLETIHTAYMEPSTSFRKKHKRSEIFRRRVLGEKGIGRFAASRLANSLEVVTRRNGTDREIRISFDWSQFDDDNKYLEDIKIPWKETRPTEISPEGTIRVLWGENEEYDFDELTHGTILRMEVLRTNWGKEQFEKLRIGLSRLVSPFFEMGMVDQKNNFKIFLELPRGFGNLSGIVRPSKTLKSPHYAIRGDVDKNGSYNINVKLKDRDSDNITGTFPLNDRPSLQCGPFHIELLVWDRDELKEIADMYGSTITDIRRDLDAVAGVSIYRDGFRVMPYGEPRNDWLGLDLRRVQNPTMRLSNNQIVGYVLISADENPELRDQSNREGLMEGAALEDLRQMVKMVLNVLETKRYDIRHDNHKTSNVKHSEGLFTDFNLKAVRDQIKQRHPDDLSLLTFVEEKEKDLERRVNEVQDVLARYRRLATLGQLIDMVLHEGRAPLAKINNESYLGLRDIERETENGDIIQRLKSRLDIIQRQANVLGAVFRKIEPFSGRKGGRPVRISLEQVISDAFSVLESEIKEIGAQISLPKNETLVTVNPSDIQQIIINLLKNSLDWLRQMPEESRSISVSTKRNGLDEVEILFSDSGPGVMPEFRKHIFDPYFSTKPDGVGLGLTIAGEIISEYYAGSLVLLDGGPLSGATFRITLRRRI